jgi:dihydrofolate synthase/folylpolyglutamate synthase
MTLDCGHSNDIIQKRLEAIYDLHTKKMDFRLDKGPYIDLLAALGNPHLHLPPVIHVAGTNGKGSTIAFLKSIYEAAGLSVHVYTSPHLIQFNERIVLGGAQITDDQLLHYFDLIDKANDGASITFFEYTTALAFKAFADNPADICLLETGLGGRLDCTNVIQNPLATLITPRGYDHTEWLGHDIKAIAGEKAGIIKAGVPCFISPQSHDVIDVFEIKADELNAPLHIVKTKHDLPALGLIGEHQKDNASVAIEVVRKNHDDINDDIITKGLKNTKWPARMEKISNDPEIWFDCGHNAEGAKTIAQQLKQWKDDESNTPVHLILGLAADKNPNEFLKQIINHIDTLTCVDLLNARNPQSGEELKEKLDMLTNSYHYRDINELLANIGKNNNKIIITGSLYLYGWARRNF